MRASHIALIAAVLAIPSVGYAQQVSAEKLSLRLR